MKPWFFSERSYKKLLAKLMEQSPSSRGIVSRVADAIGCQRSYLSQVLHSKVQLTRDQAWGICRFFELSEDESIYFECLVDLERASSPKYRKHLEEKMANLRREAGRIAKQFPENQSFSEPEALDYFASWLPSAVHILSSIPEFQSPARMATRLHVNPERIRTILHALQAKGLVKQKGSQWEFAKSVGYVPRESAYVSLHHQNWRHEAVDDSRNPQSDGLHYTMVQTVSQNDFKTLKNLVIDFIARTKDIAGPSEPELLTTLNIDLFEPR